jgi:hypothetical protein
MCASCVRTAGGMHGRCLTPASVRATARTHPHRAPRSLILTSSIV